MKRISVKKSTLLKFIIALLAVLIMTSILPSFGFIQIFNFHKAHAPDVESGRTPAETSTEPSENTHDESEPSQVENTPGEPIFREDTDVPERMLIQEETTVQEETSPPLGLPPFEPVAADTTTPFLMLASTTIMVDGQIVEDFAFPDQINFDAGETYTWFEGITAFRGNNFRDSPSYGFADIQNAKFGDKWSRDTGNYIAPGGAYWSGNGWTGQPLIAKWPKQTREIMNMYDWAKEQDELIEVIYPSMDGYVYFSELKTGVSTRDKLHLGFPFKGAGSIDPRGYPLLYVGAGYAGSGGSARIMIVSLIDGSVLYTFGNGDSFALRGWSAADASSLISADTDQLIYPSENGVLYIIKLNSEYDIDAGTITIDPSPVKWRYNGKRSQSGGKYWLGMEASPVIWHEYLIVADNGGHLICLNLNTLEPVWVQDTLDDTNCSPVLELENGHPYVYISTSFHGGWRAPMNSSAAIPILKIDANNGEIIWRTDYTCYTVDGISGGVQGTAAIGKYALNDFVYVPVARTPNRDSGILAALDKHTGDILWEFKTNQYGWSSPVCVYDKAGTGYVIYCTSAGKMYLLDGLTGEIKDTIQLGGNIEASPAVYESTIVVGTRAMKIWGITLT